ncbi:hypothetical protein DW884_02610 [Ruminococcus sp. AM40-10AC]|nr:hypothetical protein DW884_02610 [Ruminococcus sp. AM40-10AC]
MTVNFTSKEVEWIATILADRCDRSTRIFEISAIRTILAKLDVKYKWQPEEKLKVVSSADT